VVLVLLKVRVWGVSGNRNVKTVGVDCDDEGSIKQTPDVISHLYEMMGEEKGDKENSVVGARTLAHVV
jgi:hypothetical protein